MAKSAKMGDTAAISELVGIQPVAKSDPAVIDMILKYISKHKLIIYGGVAIDTYLRFHGNRGIYDDTESPDIDVYTPDIARDMYTITNMVHDLGTHRFVETIPSRTHAHSRRIRYEFGPGVIDLTPIGAETFKKLPTFTTEFRGHSVRFIDLPVIKMNLYFAMAINPLTNAFRLAKDHARLVNIKTAKTKGVTGGKPVTSKFVSVTGFHLLDKTFCTPKHPIILFSNDPYADSEKVFSGGHDEFAPFLDFPGYLSGKSKSGEIVQIYFYPESNFILMPKCAYGLLYFFHVKYLECVVTGRRDLIDEYVRAINYVENGKYVAVDISPLLIPPNPVRQVVSSAQPNFDRIYRPEKKRRDSYDGVVLAGISGEKLN